MGSASLPPRESLAASDAMGAARQQLQATELWFVALKTVFFNKLMGDFF